MLFRSVSQSRYKAYENKIAIESCIKKVHEQQGTIEKTESIINEIEEVYRKAKAFDTFLKYKEHVEKYNNSDCHELERVFEFVMKEYEEEE